MRRSNREDRH